MCKEWGRGFTLVSLVDLSSKVCSKTKRLRSVVQPFKCLNGLGLSQKKRENLWHIQNTYFLSKLQWQINVTQSWLPQSSSRLRGIFQHTMDSIDRL